MADKTDGGYSRTLLGTVGTDGIQRDLQGNPIPVGLDEDTRKELESMLAPRQVRVVPSEWDIYNAAAGRGLPTETVPLDGSDDNMAKALKPGYSVTGASSTGEVPGSDAEKDAKASDSAPKSNG